MLPPGPSLLIDASSSSPAYRQIVDQIRTLIVEGILRPGGELPSVRRLGTDLGVHFNTVAEAYRTLAAEGWIDIAHGRGVRVLQRAIPGPPEPEAVEKFRLRLRQIVAEMRAAGLSKEGIASELNLFAKGIQP